MSDKIIPWTHLTEVLAQGAAYFLRTARGKLAADGSNASGALSQSMSTEVVIGEEQYCVKVNLADYWKFVDRGTRGRKNGNPSRRLPPLSAIQKWIEVKPVRPRPAANGKLPTTQQLAWMIARKIRDFGTTGTGFFSSAEEATEAQFRKAIEEAIAADVRDAVTGSL